jgi:outer membrane protein OmpA-like peptidoglycan-associated protein
MTPRHNSLTPRIAGLALVAALAGALGLARPALAQEPPVSWYTNSPLLLDSEPAVLELTSDEELEDVTVTIRSGRQRTSTHRIGLLRPGDSARVELAAALGRHDYEAVMEGTWNRARFRLRFEFPFEVTEGMRIEVPLEQVDLDARQLVLVLSRPVQRVDYVVTGDDGGTLGSGSVRFSGERAGTPLVVPWTQSEGTILRLALTAHDVDGFWSEVELLPWSVEIPHEEVHFESGSHAIPEYEAHKVDDAYRELVRAVERYGELVAINLYVAGYTDTVGSASDNQALSERRARSIAQAFRARGFAFPIFYQGFGESALAVPTPDHTDEVQNRRALYILAAQPPLPSTDIPRSHWRPID